MVSEYPLFLLNNRRYKILKRWDAKSSGESTWRLLQIVEDSTLFVCCGLGTMEQRYCIEEGVRLNKTPRRVKKELLTYLGKTTVDEVGPLIYVSSIGREMRDSNLPF
jgi:hypothetical protein